MIRDEKCLHEKKNTLLFMNIKTARNVDIPYIHTFPATETVWKFRASSAQIWAWVTFSEKVKSERLSPVPIIN